MKRSSSAGAFVILILLCGFFSTHAISQTSTRFNNAEIIKKSFGFSVIHLLSQKSKVYGDKSLYNLGSAPQIGLELLINYYYGFEKNYSIVASIGGGLLSHNFSYSIPSEMFDPPQQHDVAYSKAFGRQMDLLYLKTVFELQRKFGVSVKSKWVAAAGVGILYSTGGSIGSQYLITSPDGTQYPYLATSDDYSNKSRPWFNYHIAAGHEWKARQGRLLQIMLKLNYSPTNFFSGTYKFTVGNQPDVTGNYGVSGSYLGLSLSYFFTKFKKVQER